jgi:hypothetical protein
MISSWRGTCPAFDNIKGVFAVSRALLDYFMLPEAKLVSMLRDTFVRVNLVFPEPSRFQSSFLAW